MSNIAFNKKITELSYENSGLDIPVGSIYDFQDARAYLEPKPNTNIMTKGQPYIIANINNPSENLRVGILTNIANLSFMLLPPSRPFATPIKENPQNYIFYNYLQLFQIITRGHSRESISRFNYLLGYVPKLYNNQGLHEVKLNHLQEGTEYIIVNKETMDMYRCKFLHIVDTIENKGGLFEFELNKLPFNVKIIINNNSFNFYLNVRTSLNRLSEISMLKRDRTSLNVNNGMLINRKKTLRWVESQSRQHTDTNNESCVTILIVAHGIMYKNVKINKSIMKGVNISLMGGGSDIYGLGGNINTHHVIIPSIIDNGKTNYTVTGNKARSDMSIDLISQIYPALLDKYYPTGQMEKKCSRSFFRIFKNIISYLKTFYKAVGIHTFPKQGEYGEDGKIITSYDEKTIRQRRNSFSIFTSFNEKILYFSPSQYQNCINSNTITKKEDCVLVEPEDNRELSFGISMLQSSNPSDFEYTLAGISKNSRNYKSANLTNWRHSEVRDYWASKLLENTELFPVWERDHYFALYDRISRPLDPDGIYDDRTNLPSIELSQLIELFKVGMGFSHINIIDYSCNTCKIQLSDLNRSLIDVVGSHPVMKLHRETKNRIRTTMKNPEKVIMSLKNPTIEQITSIVGKKAKSTSYGKTVKNAKKTSTRRKSLGGKNKKN